MFFGEENKKQVTNHIKEKAKIDENEYMSDRVVYKIRIYSRLAEKQKRLYQALSVIGIVLSSLVTIQINFNFTGSQLLATVLSVLVTMTVSIERLFRFREHWGNYDEMAARLRSEQLKYQTRSEDYSFKASSDENASSDEKDKAAFELFVKRIERAINDERKDTIEMRTSDNGPTTQLKPIEEN